MKFIRKHKKISITILISLSVVLILSVAYGRYFFNIINNYILESKKFYFNSTVLGINEKKYQINNWNGVSSYTFTIDLNNRKTEERFTTADIEYNIYVDCDNSLICTTNKTEDILRENVHTNSYIVTVNPQRNFRAGEQARVTTYVTSSTPYTKTLKATYYLNVVNEMFTYNIEDSENDLILNLNLTNSLDYYEVETAFSTYQVGDKISTEDYNELTPAQQANCYSAKVTLTFDPNIIRLDSTDESIRNRLSTNYQTTNINGNSYVSKYSFKVDSSTNKKIVFYKADPSNNYTYPITNQSSIITVDVVLPQE